MSQSNQNKPLARVIGAAVATGGLVAGSLFGMQAMAHGYATEAAPASIAAEGKCGEGKCGEGKCGSAEAKRDAASGQASGKRQHKPKSLSDMDTDKDGRISRAEFAAAHDGKADKFAAHDADGNGFISQAELDAHHAGMKAKKDAKGAEGKCGEGKCGEGKCGSKS